MQEPESFPQTIGRYEIRRLLGAGAMGSVYLAEDPRIKRKLAIKVVKLDAIRNEAERKEFLARFQREAEVSGVLNDPGIVTIYDVGDSDVGPFLAMEFVPGRPLDAYIKSGDILSMPIQAKLQIAAGIASALDHAHAHGITHRDVKPGNVMITEDGRPKLMDFGIAKKEDASLTQTGTFLGTPSYASPEQIREGHATSRSDIFSFGVMVFELLSGVLPFPGSSINTILYRIVNEPPVDIVPPVVGLLPDRWQSIFSKVLSKSPEERYATCSAFMKDLVDAAVDLDAGARMELAGLLRQGATAPSATLLAPLKTVDVTSPGLPVHAGSTSSKWLLSGIAAGVVAVLGVGGFLLFRKGGGQVLVETVPAQAKVLKNGVEVGLTNLQVLLKAGDRLVIDRKGFERQDYLLQGHEQRLKFDLKGIVREERLVTNPPGAEVVIDAKKLSGVTPITVKWDQGKKHELTFTHLKEGKSLATSFLEGEGPGGNVYTLLSTGEPRLTGEVPAVDKNAPAVIRLNGEFGVRVKVDGKDMGEQSRLSLSPGSHRLELSSSRYYYRETRTVNAAPGQNLTLALPGLARLTVETFPTSGTVVIDGIPTGVESDGGTPITVSRGSHSVSIQGKAGSGRSVDVPGDKNLKFKL